MSDTTTVPRKRRPKKEIGEGTLSHLAFLSQEIVKILNERKRNTHGYIVVMRKTRFVSFRIVRDLPFHYRYSFSICNVEIVHLHNA